MRSTRIQIALNLVIQYSLIAGIHKDEVSVFGIVSTILRIYSLGIGISLKTTGFSLTSNARLMRQSIPLIASFVVPFGVLDGNLPASTAFLARIKAFNSSAVGLQNEEMWASFKSISFFEGREFDYKDDFKIRYWKPEVIDSMLREAGFIDTGVTFPQFQGTYSTYKLYRKI